MAEPPDPGDGPPALKRAKTEEEQLGDSPARGSDVVLADVVARVPQDVPDPVKELLGALDLCWGELCNHELGPLGALRHKLSDKHARETWAFEYLSKMKVANPRFGQHLTKHLNKEDVENTTVGVLTEGHILMMSIDRMTGNSWPAFWKKDPSHARIRDVWTTALLTGRGMDLSSRSLKVCVAPEMVDVPDLRQCMFYAGYIAGSTLGAGCILLACMLMSVAADLEDDSSDGASLWQLQAVNQFVITSSRLPLKLVLHASPQDRINDALLTKAHLNQVEENHGLLAANAMVQSKLTEPWWIWNATTVDAMIKKINEACQGVKTAYIGDSKARVIKNVILDMPTQVVDKLHRCYQAWSWEFSWMSEDLLRQAFWKGSHCAKVSKKWLGVYKSNPDVLMLFVDILDKQWGQMWPGNTPEHDVRSQSRTVIGTKRPGNVVADDGSGQNSLTEAKLVLLCCMAVHGWIIHRVEEAAGPVGVQRLQDNALGIPIHSAPPRPLSNFPSPSSPAPSVPPSLAPSLAPEELINGWERNFLEDVKYVVRQRDNPASYDAITLKQLEYTCAVVTTGAQPVAGLRSEAGGPENTPGALRKALDTWKQDWDYDMKAFKQMAALRSLERERQLKWDLEESQKQVQMGTQMVTHFISTYFQAPGPLKSMESLSETVRAFHSAIDDEFGSPAAALVLWDLNTFKDIDAEMKGLKEFLLLAPLHRAAFVLLRQGPVIGPPKKSKSIFHADLVKKLDADGLEVESAGIQIKDNGKMERLLFPAWIVLLKTSVETSIWAWSSLWRGLVRDCDAPGASDYRRADILDEYGDQKPTSQWSKYQRNQIVLSGVALGHVVSEAFDNVLDASQQSGVPVAKNSKGQPVAVIALWNPVALNVVDTLLKYQKETWDASPPKPTLRVGLLCDDSIHAAYLSEIQRQVAEHWYGGAFRLPEFPFPHKRPYVSEQGATLSADFKVGRVFKGKLVPLEDGLEKFKYHPAFKDEVATLLQELAAQKAQQPCWDQDEGVAEEPMRGDPAGATEEWNSRFPALQALLDAPKKADAQSKDNKITWFVTKDGQGWAHVLEDVTVSIGTKALGWGAGKRREADSQPSEGEFSMVSMSITTDKTVVYEIDQGADGRSMNKRESMHTLHGLLTQMALDGKTDARLKYHDCQPMHNGAAGRRVVKPIGERHWAASKSTTAEEDACQNVSYRQLLRFIKADHLMNKYWQIAWDVTVSGTGTEHTITQERPWLAWRSNFTFAKGTWFRWG